MYKIVKHVVAIQALFLQREWEKFAILSLINKMIGHRKRSIWSQEQMKKFVDLLLLGLCTEREFKKQSSVTYITFKFCERG